MQIIEKSVEFPVTLFAVTFSAPARLAPAPVTEYIAQAHVAPHYPQFSTGLVNPQFSTACVEVSASESTRNIVSFPSVLEQVQIGDIPVPQIVDDTVEIHVTERIQEQIGPERIEEQVGGIPVPQIVDDAVEVVIGNVQVIAAAGSVVAENTTQNSLEIQTVHESMTDETF